jgi:NAD(P)-dependent dehydrogenase (short-subunit alcohol dehydrogenase family)
MTAELEGKHVAVTGAGGVLGSAIARRLVRAGATCHLPVRGERAVALLEGGDLDPARARVTPGVDLADEQATRDYYASVPPLWGSIHAAGGFAMAGVVDTTLEQFEAMFRINATTCFLCCREAIRSMRGAGGGRIVNVAARPAIAPAGGLVAYTTSKAAVASMTQCLADEVQADGILVNAVAPSVIDSAANRAGMPDAAHDRWPTPAQIAEAVAFLVSPKNELTWGALVPVYGRA